MGSVARRLIRVVGGSRGGGKTLALIDEAYDKGYAAGYEQSQQEMFRVLALLPVDQRKALVSKLRELEEERT